MTSEGKPTGEIASKSEIHKLGLYHNTAHIWIFNEKGHILLQQRSSKKTFHPLLWDVSVAGHVDSGETIRQAAVRETREEISLLISENNLKKIGIFKSFRDYKNGYIDNEFHHTYICKTDAKISDLIANPDEVESLKFVNKDEFLHILDNIGKDHHFIASNKSYYQYVFYQIQDYLKLV